MLGKTLLACATFVVAAVAQSQIIAFTNPPASITAGKPIELTWAGGDSSAVTLTLQQGLPSDLQTVQLITGSATGTSYTWNVPSSLPDASNYAFKIQQGDNPPNYTGMITLTGGATSGPTLAVSALASSSSSTASSTGSSSSVPTNPASGGIVGGSGSNSTTPSSAGNATTTAPSGAAIGTGAVGSGSAATGTALSRNTTMSHATLTSSSTSSTSSSSSTSSGSESTGTSTTSSGPAPSSSSSATMTLATSNFALLCAAVVGIAYLG